ncbi:hypothetical protein E2C01_022176 [Portunus trituberculatus]|uniref:Uncharacterized protein n=1 Tax=Portunus trituberculatus TaxID=210409 RepID=A0A5B7E4P1_PORTR|nr:hypothetical protein [Portunus trituberculatus]
MSAPNIGSFSSTLPTTIVDITEPRSVVQWPVTPHNCRSATGRSCTATTSSPMMVFAAPVYTTMGHGWPSTLLSTTPVRPSHCRLTATSSFLNSSDRSCHSLLSCSDCWLRLLSPQLPKLRQVLTQPQRQSRTAQDGTATDTGINLSEGPG